MSVNEPGPSDPAYPASPDANTPAARGGFRNGMAIAAMVLGVVGIVLAFLIPILGIILGIIAVILAIVARRRGEAVPGHGRGLILAGIILGALAIIVSVVEVILVAVLVSNR